MSLARLKGAVSPESFVENYYQRVPHSESGAARELCELGSWQVLDRILGDRHAGPADLMVVRAGRRYEGPAPTSISEAQRLFAEGYTLLVRHAERHHAGIAELAAGFERDLSGPANVHMYLTPGDQFGFGWHYDAEEVFILQTLGRKEYSLRKNTVNPWPLEESLPADMQYERELMPLMKCELLAGDWLYIPSGYWHKATAGDDAISLAVGIMPRTGVDVFDWLRPRVLESLLWRQRLPVAGEASPLAEDATREAYRHIFATLSQDLSKLLSDDGQLDDFLNWMKLPAVTGQLNEAKAP